jgi:dipeptidyl aminopeptidase/acylaminoacyl peptidase
MLLYLLAVCLWQATPPDTEVFLASLSVQDGKAVLGKPVNISSSPGYDNQPSFTADGRSILFTSGRAGGTTDIYRYDIDARAVTRVTETPEAEYSPTLTPDGKGISVIRVEADGTQRLWRFTPDGKQPALVLTDVKPVGYHAWADAQTLALFVLGQPATLQLADTTTGKAETIASGIGRSITRVPGRGTICFVVRERAAEGKPASASIRELDPRTRQVTTLVAAVPGAADPDLAWTPDGMLLMAHDGALHGWRRGDAAWTRLADLEPLGLRGVSRLAVSPKGDRIAIVARP